MMKTGDERGFALIMTIFFALLVTLLGSTYLYVNLNGQRYATFIQDSEMAVYKSKAGLRRTELHLMQRSGSLASAQTQAPRWVPSAYQTQGYLIRSEIQNDDQLLEADVFVLASETTYTLISRGKHRGAERVIVEVIELNGSVNSLARYNLFQNSNSMPAKFGGSSIWFVPGDSFTGPVHMNAEGGASDRIRIITDDSGGNLIDSPIFTGEVTTVKNEVRLRTDSRGDNIYRYQASPPNSYDLMEDELPDWKDTIFQGGISYLDQPLAMIQQSQTGSDFDAMKREAVRRGTILPEYRVVVTSVGSDITETPTFSYWKYTGSQTTQIAGDNPYDLGQTSEVPSLLVNGYQFYKIEDNAQVWVNNPSDPQSKVEVEKRKFDWPFYWLADYYVRATDISWFEELGSLEELNTELQAAGFEQEIGPGADISSPRGNLWIRPPALSASGQTERIEVEPIEQWKIVFEDDEFSLYYTPQTPDYTICTRWRRGRCTSTVDYGEPHPGNDGGDTDSNDPSWVRVTAANNTWGIQTGLQASTGGAGGNELIYFSNNLYVEGIISESASVITEDHLYLGNGGEGVRYRYLVDHPEIDVHNFNPDDHPDFDYYLGMIARGDIIISQYFNGTDIDIHGSLLAAEGSFWYSLYNQDLAAAHDQIELFGGLAQDSRGPVGMTNGKGFTKDYVYDERLRGGTEGQVTESQNRPPAYPLVKSGDIQDPTIRPVINISISRWGEQ
ncbi:MAG: hypothetical protein ACE5JP_09655 [Candidatus Bipolaricaulia bacterium]